MALFPEEVIATAENIIGYEFPEQKKHILASALNASGSTKILYGARIETNKRLAIFGDVVLTKTLCVRWIDSGLEVGDWSAVRSTTLSTKELGRIGKEAGLDKAIVASQGQTDISVNMLATAVQAVIGAVQSANGPNGATEEVERVMAKLRIESKLLAPREQST